MQQPLAELGLQAPYLLADGGLGEPQPFRGAGEVGLVGDRNEVRQLPQDRPTPRASPAVHDSGFPNCRR